MLNILGTGIVSVYIGNMLMVINIHNCLGWFTKNIAPEMLLVYSKICTVRTKYPTSDQEYGSESLATLIKI